LTQKNEKVKNNKCFCPPLQNKESLAKVALKSERKRFYYVSNCFVIPTTRGSLVVRGQRSDDLSCGDKSLGLGLVVVGF
jgi:hypothetical protein